MNTSLISSFKIQMRVIYALIMREIITRYGRHNLGFMWLFLEPMIFTLGISVLWTATKATHGNSMQVVPFAVIGYSTVLCWRNPANRVGNAIDANIGLLFHRNVKVLDVFLSRTILEISGATISFLILSIIFNLTGMMNLPKDLLRMLLGWFLLVWFAIGLSLVVGAIFQISEIIDRLWHAFTYLLFPLSGAAFFVYWLPPTIRDFVLYIPMVHASEMIKHGYYGDLVPTFESPLYLISVNLVLSFIGLSLTKYISKKVEGSS